MHDIWAGKARQQDAVGTCAGIHLALATLQDSAQISARIASGALWSRHLSTNTHSFRDTIGDDAEHRRRLEQPAHGPGIVHRPWQQDDLLALVDTLNADPAIDGILVQLPLPGHIDERAVTTRIDPDKDVDGFHPVNAGRLATGLPGFVPCTPLGCVMLLKDTLGDLTGLDAVVIGRSNIVGKPMAQLLIAESCTVTVAHSRTRDLSSGVKRADIVIAAVGRPEMVKGDWLKPGATVIDVGINRTEAGLVGDVDFAGAMSVAGAVTPVPGGVGPMTIACLLRNTLVSAARREGVVLDEAAL